LVVYSAKVLGPSLTRAGFSATEPFALLIRSHDELLLASEATRFAIRKTQIALTHSFHLGGMSAGWP
jgi:uncharacterized protein (DUF1684 family)